MIILAYGFVVAIISLFVLAVYHIGYSNGKHDIEETLEPTQHIPQNVYVPYCDPRPWL